MRQGPVRLLWRRPFLLLHLRELEVVEDSIFNIPKSAVFAAGLRGFLFSVYTSEPQQYHYAVVLVRLLCTHSVFAVFKGYGFKV